MPSKKVTPKVSAKAGNKAHMTKPAPEKKAAGKKPAAKVTAKVIEKPAAKAGKVKEAPAPKAAKAGPAAKETNVSKVAPTTLKGKPAPAPVDPSLPVETKEEKTKRTKAEKAAAKVEAKAAQILETANTDWLELHKQFKNIKPLPYSMGDEYPEKCVINHKLLGIGFVIKNINNRIDVVFKDGQKTLITNYKK